MYGLKYTIALMVLLVTSSATAMTDGYLEALEKAHERSYAKADSLFRAQLKAFEDDPIYLNRTRVWLALSLMAEDALSLEAETVLHKVLCEAQIVLDNADIVKTCPPGKTWVPSSTIDLDMISAAVAAYGSIQWRRGEYKTAIQSMNFAIEHALDTKPEETNIESALKQLDSTQPNSLNEDLNKKQTQLQASMLQQLKDEHLAPKGQETFVQSIMSEIIAKEEKKLALTITNPNLAGSANRQLLRVAASEPEIFYNLARTTMCQDSNAPVDTTPQIKDVNRSIEKPMAAMLEAFRGQYVQSFKIAQRPVLRSLNKFLDSKQKLPEGFQPLAHQRHSFLQSLGDCSDSLNLEESFGKALLVALVRPARPHRSEQYLRLLISTTRRLRLSQHSPDPFVNIQETFEHGLLGDFYLRSHQPDKALPELLLAMKGSRPAAHMTQYPEFAYIPLINAARTLQSMVDASLQSNKDLGELEQEMHRLRQHVDSLKTDIVNRLAMSPEQVQADQLKDMKQMVNETFQTQEMQGLFQGIASMLPESQEGSDHPNPMSQVQQMLNSLNSGAMDGIVLDAVQNEGTDSTMNVQDVFGNSLERQYQLHNNHSQLLLQLAHIELDMDKPDAARRQLQEAGAYIQSNPNWIGARTIAYQEYARARLFSAENKSTEASLAFGNAIKGWYSTPHSTSEMIWAPLESKTEILEQAVAFSISEGQAAQAFNYLELMREASWKGNQLYGALSEQGLISEDQSLQQKALNLQKIAADQANDLGESERLKSALQKATVSVQQSQLDPAYKLLTRIEALAPWLESSDMRQFVENILKQVKRRKARGLNQARIDFLYRQQGMTTPGGAGYYTSTPYRDNATALSTQIQQKLSDDTLVISIWMGRDTSYITALDKKDVRAHQQPSLPLLRLVNTFNNTYKRSHGYKLYQKLLAPYLDRSYNRIVLVANGPLQNTAFAALSTDLNKQLWLGDRYLLRTLPNTTRLLKPVKPSSGPATVLVLNGSSVPGKTKLETSEIDTIFQYFSGKHVEAEQLTRKNLIDQLPLYSIAHFAGHSEVNNEFPDFSHLTLYNDKAYLLELEQLPLDKVRLMVLGSCESAAHADSGFGNEFSSLHESLLNAGAESVLANLFPVNDQIASELLSRFYKLLAQGYDKDSALQKAQQFVRVKNPNPKDWAGFILSGSELAL